MASFAQGALLLGFAACLLSLSPLPPCILAADISPDAMRASSDVAGASAQEVLSQAREAAEWVTSLRRQLHRHPELMFEEEQTSQLVQDTLKGLGIPFTTGIAGTGVVATIGTGAAPVVALRADMDALPILEEADVDFPSTVPGKMHACGHDGHTAMLLGAARLLQQRHQASPLPGTVRLLFQPAEEGGAGGAKLVQAGALEGVHAAFALHVLPALETGLFAGRAGAFMAGTGQFEMTVKGKGGHAAFPHLATDPILASAHIITSLQSLVSRETDPLGSTIVAVSTIHAGTARNIIPDEAKLAGTFRSLDKEQVVKLQARVEEVAVLQARVHNCEATVTFRTPYPPTINDASAFDHAQHTVAKLFGQEAFREIPPAMTGEDFAFIQEAVPGAMLWLGVRNEGKNCTSGLHTAKFKLDEDALPLGVAFHVLAAEDFLRSYKPLGTS